MTTITTAKLREMAHTLGATAWHLQAVILSNYGVTIDDTPVDDTAKDTEAQEAAMQDDLEQRVRDLIWQACHGDLMVAEATRAIIPMVLEHAAKVAESKTQYRGRTIIAAAIRAGACRR